MTERVYTLLADGSSDKRLIFPINWAFARLCTVPVVPQFAELGKLPAEANTLRARILAALDRYPCDILVVHRDSEGQAHGVREAEINDAIQGLGGQSYARVIPVRMQEAWLLIDEGALRRAANNPRGRNVLPFPRFGQLETLTDPKGLLYNLLKEASGFSGRRLKRFRAEVQAHRLAEIIRDYSPLAGLDAFQRFELDLRGALQHLGILRAGV